MTDRVRPRLREAMDLAYQLHGADARKESEVPVMAHLLSVCAIVQHDGGTEDQAIAALLHDSLEDKPEQIDAPEIERRFGAEVRKIVEVSTDTPPDYVGGPKAKWRERKESYLARVKEAETRLLRVTVADKVDNLRAILADYRRLGDKIWSRFKGGKEGTLWYYPAALQAYRDVGFSGALLEEMERLVRELGEAVNG